MNLRDLKDRIALFHRWLSWLTILPCSVILLLVELPSLLSLFTGFVVRRRVQAVPRRPHENHAAHQRLVAGHVGRRAQRARGPRDGRPRNPGDFAGPHRAASHSRLVDPGPDGPSCRPESLARPGDGRQDQQTHCGGCPPNRLNGEQAIFGCLSPESCCRSKPAHSLAFKKVVLSFKYNYIHLVTVRRGFERDEISPFRKSVWKFNYDRVLAASRLIYYLCLMNYKICTDYP